MGMFFSLSQGYLKCLGYIFKSWKAFTEEVHVFYYYLKNNAYGVNIKHLKPERDHTLWYY